MDKIFRNQIIMFIWLLQSTSTVSQSTFKQTKSILVRQILIFTDLFLQLYAETFISKL